MESEDLLFPIEEVVDNVAVENKSAESGNKWALHAVKTLLKNKLLIAKRLPCGYLY